MPRPQSKASIESVFKRQAHAEAGCAYSIRVLKPVRTNPQFYLSGPRVRCEVFSANKYLLPNRPVLPLLLTDVANREIEAIIDALAHGEDHAGRNVRANLARSYFNLTLGPCRAKPNKANEKKQDKDDAVLDFHRID